MDCLMQRKAMLPDNDINFLHEKLWHFDHSIALFCLRRGNQVLPIEPLI